MSMLSLTNTKMYDAIAFFVNTNEWPNYHCHFIHTVYRLDVNEYKGRRSVQLIIEYLEPLIPEAFHF